MFYDSDSRFPVLPYLATVNPAVAINFVRTPFRTSPDTAAHVMDQFVAEKTDGNLKSGLVEVDHSTRMVLMSIVKISLLWEAPPSPWRTKTRIFCCPNNVEKRVDFIEYELLMARSFNVFKCEDDNPQVIILDLSEYKFSVMIILPYPNSGGTDKLQEKMTIGNLLAWRQKCVWEYPYILHVFLPKFRIRCGVNLKSCTTRMGLQQVYEEADYGRMFEGDTAVKIDEFRQDVVLELNEHGTGDPLPQLNLAPHLNWGGLFLADRPFYCVIWDETANAPVALGRITDPSM
ncbi:serine protease inhibitor A6-like [Paramacrobiotus metropolitanus]|uniref:serine protease inhibitor A6-like n=1 Tax=Paramacrobiotus metropolitanus TaxID=2943436 RepID=UPI0024459143|nr:serine protease inhibitor A6-like [Paramacrobiotus metropolitanus]